MCQRRDAVRTSRSNLLFADDRKLARQGFHLQVRAIHADNLPVGLGWQWTIQGCDGDMGSLSSLYLGLGRLVATCKMRDHLYHLERAHLLRDAQVEEAVIGCRVGSHEESA